MDLAVEITWHTFVVLAAIVGVIALYCTDRAPIEMTATGAVALALLFFHFWPLSGEAAGFGPAELLAGFANPALLTIMALLVVGQGMFQTGALEAPTRVVTALARRWPWLTLGLVFAVVLTVSAFLNNTPVVVMFIPVVAAIAHRLGHAPSKVMIPLSFVSILGGMTTIIGTSTNLLVADVLEAETGGRLTFFAPTPMGAALAAAGVAYLIFFGPRWLPVRRTLEADIAAAGQASEPLDGRQFVAQIEITPGHPLLGRKPVAGMFPNMPDITVRLVQRGERALLPPFDALEIAENDVVIIAATRKTLVELLSSRAAILRGMLSAEADGPDIDALAETTSPRDLGGLALVEAVVAPGSRMIGRTIEQLSFRAQTGCIVLGLQRRARMIRGRMDDIRLEAGDLLLLLGAPNDLRRLRAQRDVLPLEWSTTDLPDLRRAARARVIFLAVVAAAALSLLPILHASILGAIAMVGAGCVNIRQAARAFDLRVYLLIGSSFTLGAAMQATGGADLLAWGVVAAFEPFGAFVLLSALFFVVAALTNLLSNSATAILFTPIAVAAAGRLEVDPTPFALTVLFAANCSFATPIAYQTNLLVMGPGHYRFFDFVRFGAPLVVLLWLVFTAMAPILFRF